MLRNNLGPSPVLLPKECTWHKCARALGQGPRKSVPGLILYSVDQVWMAGLETEVAGGQWAGLWTVVQNLPA